MKRLGALLEKLALENKGVLNQVMAKMPDSAKGPVKAAIAKAEKVLERVRRTDQASQSGQDENGPVSTQSGGDGQVSNSSGQNGK
jgi:hypothetical protein